MADINTIRRRRQKGTGTILDRNGIYVVRWTDTDGKKHQESTGLSATTRNKKAAAELLAKRTAIYSLTKEQEMLEVLIRQKEAIQAKIARLQKIATPTLKLSGLADAFTSSPKRKDYKPAALASHLRHLQAFVDWAADDMDVAEITDDVAVRYATYLGKRFAGSTYNKHLDSLAAVWKALSGADGVKVNPWEGIARKRLEAHSRRALTDEEIKRLLAAAKGEYRDLIIIGLRTGMRLGDCCRLKWDDFKEDGTVEAVTSKTGAFVKLPSKALLTDLGRQEKNGYICPESARLYSSSSRSNLCYYLGKVFAEAGIDSSVAVDGYDRKRADATFHSLRHTFVTKAISAGVPVAIVRALVGHTTETMTEHYMHVQGETVADAFLKAGL